MTYQASILADSVSPDGVRLTTMAVRWPHAVHKDFMTHRMWSRNFESFRARPPEQVIAEIAADPFIPDAFSERVTGMQQGKPVDEGLEGAIRQAWLTNMSHTIELARYMVKQNIAKQQINFLLQDYSFIAGIITATEWDNFWALRLELDADGNPMARPEVYRVAKLMKEAYDSSTPTRLDYGAWHLPLVTPIELELNSQGLTGADWSLVSAGRCARWSYGAEKALQDEVLLTSMDRADRLKRNGHMSPFEHQARPFGPNEVSGRADLATAAIRSGMSPWRRREVAAELGFSGNFRGWVQHRKMIPNESNYGLMVDDVR